ncbi:MAG: ABC transporter C-terminal domain-containing protein [Planctomycetota bacterium]
MASKAGAAQPANSSSKSTKAASKPATKQRRFPYRKVEDLEEEIINREMRIASLHDELNQGAVRGDGQRVRSIQTEIAEVQQALQTLYEHWEEATELNR